jgi:hypothetical protein
VNAVDRSTTQPQVLGASTENFVTEATCKHLQNQALSNKPQRLNDLLRQHRMTTALPMALLSRQELKQELTGQSHFGQTQHLEKQPCALPLPS